MLTSIAGRSVIVTGASKGIGKGIARVFASKGAKVLVVSRHQAEAEKTVEEIKKAGGSASAFAADVSQLADMEKMAEAAISRQGGIDILCANAGIFPAAKIKDMTPEDFDNVIAINLKGTFLSIKACLPAMKKKGKGRIVITSSITGPITGYPGWTHYGASKAGQLGFMRTAAIELAPANITVNAVMPGNIKTEGLDGLGPDYLKKMSASVPQGRLGTVEDIAYAALFFASDEAGYITGQTMVIDGGQILPESLMALEEMLAS
ncbi:MAG TPA: 3-oxoacyl-ACP reductase FabG [Hypericibacter adhaerens]|jgi:3-oxoacyl-[acyl-carrier protein] reductase|uniref:3-oxoacyl-(ACP) reductase n=1 Tax=Hypericibacter adhaerens TaxID=2602016 RepID=A0A5J6N0U7_9PROT|nr:3-oxoacyl-ACP reductase FabG [Hypericibacter adhaerens]QEX22575.1 3-oxoacyl-(ACP) reductase [Hypericibacter adhaerens]HWA41909.1 3-oxoacyl-ACP reductase FabG [Hypericibacter adhaerens]